MIVKRAFQLIHEIGVSHGDVRRENILLREDNSVVIVDFESGEFEELSEEAIGMEDKSCREATPHPGHFNALKWQFMAGDRRPIAHVALRIDVLKCTQRGFFTF